ncbi:hypothetical protein TCDM_11228 [Trypanosoma cruzi Dm28c]|uniref:Uncharacterized protein n=1 Tax=Trypanosoma cruzi Dm28c TaxID=1416333 RepID=V5D160_TRYCR|nr:hypothetical protein TCDM_11228 [Trypanosoma cruzi Dm28c]
MRHGAQLSAVTRGASHPQENRLGVRSLPSSSWPRKKTTAATRNCQHALQKKHSNPPQCASCVCVSLCVPAETQSKDAEKREQSMWRDAQKCTAGTHNGNNNKKTAQTHDYTAAQAAAIHTIFIENKKTSPSSCVNPTTQNNYK